MYQSNIVGTVTTPLWWIASIFMKILYKSPPNYIQKEDVLLI